MSKTKIEWATEVWNPVTGCTKISPGCKNCYAERMSKRLAGRSGYPKDEPFQVTWHTERLTQPFVWFKPQRIFVCSMGDLFHKDVPISFIDQVFTVIDACVNHTFLILTKRPERMQEYCTANPFPPQPLPNVWLGVSVENQEAADERIPILLQTPAAVRFVSVEPMLGEVDLTAIHLELDTFLDSLTGEMYTQGQGPVGPHNYQKLDWVICGGESGPGRRPMKLEWARSLRDQCQVAGVPFFMKQIDKVQPIPKDLMIREFPQNV